MPDTGYFAQKRGSPTGLALVILTHAALLSALVLIKGPQIIRPDRGPLVVTPIEVPPDPAPVPPRPQDDPAAQDPVTSYNPPPRPFNPPTSGPTSDTLPPTRWNPGPVGNSPVQDPPADPPATPVRRDAEVDPRFVRELQPPYPASEERAQRGGAVRIRVTIGANGRVSAVARLSATNDAFWRTTERQALSRWRFRPATVDGRPVESTKTLTVHFRIEDI